MSYGESKFRVDSKDSRFGEMCRRPKDPTENFTQRDIRINTSMSRVT